MLKRYRIIMGCMLLLLVAGTGCSTKKNTGFSRFWHRTNTYFNGYFNGREAIKEGVTDLSKTRKDNFNNLITPYHYGPKENWGNMSSQADKAMKKAVIMIQKHSMLINGQQYNKWIDDCYMLMGKANYFKQEFYTGAAQLRYVADNSEKESTKTEAYIWMMKTYNALGELPDAAAMLLQLKKRDIPAKLLEEYNTTLAEYYLLKGQKENAVKALEEAIANTKPKRRKARYQFLIGQIYQSEEYDKDAYESFAKALKMKPEYEIEFQSRINMARTSTDNNNDGLRLVLRKMLKDDKNIEYQDQIYYALGTIDLKEEKRLDAIDNFEKSLRSALAGSTQTPITYLVLAELYLKEKNYEPAQAYYDSAAVTLDKSHPKYEEILRLKTNLSELVANIRMINLQDSLQRLGQMSESDLLVFLENYVEELKEKDEEEKNNPQPIKTNPNSNNPFGQTEGNSYWYNEQSKAFGANEFGKIWGTRILEDDWRRSNKTTFNTNNPTDNPEDGAENPRYMVETYLREIPRTDSAMQASNELLYAAMYNLGAVYKEKIRDLPNAVDAFKALEKRNTDNVHFPITYYQLYLSYIALKDQPKADVYRDILINQYPESDYARLLQDPDYIRKLEEKDNKAAPYYQETYTLYTRGEYSATMTNCLLADTAFEGSSLLHRFALLYSLSIGKTKTEQEFVASLTDVKTKYAGTESAETAQRLLDALNKGKPVEGAGGNDGGTTTDTAPKTVWDETQTGDYFVLILIPDKAKNLTDAKNGISNFNDENYSTKAYTVNNAILGNYSMLSVRKFANSEEALAYRSVFLGKGLVESLKMGSEVKVVITNAKNFTQLFKTQDVSGYWDFFKKTFKVD